MNAQRIALLVENLFEDLEFWCPRIRLIEAGYRVEVIGTGKRTYAGRHGLAAEEDLSADQANADDYRAVLIPGGYSAYHMRHHPALLELVRRMHEAGRIIAFMGHAGRVIAAAGILRGQRLTSNESLRTDLEAAGARWVDEQVVRDGNLISARGFEDLPAFCRMVMRSLDSG